MFQNRNLQIVLFLLSVISNTSFTSQKFLPVDDFESQRHVNLLGGLTGCWEKDPHDTEEYCKSEFLTDKIADRESSVLYLKYRLTARDYNGYFTKLNGLDARAFSVISFYAKGGKKFPRIFKVELKNHLNEVGSYIVSGITHFWRKITIPLEEFSGITDFSKLTEFVIVFEGVHLEDTEGELYIDDINFEAPLYEYEKKLAVIQKENLELKEKFRRISRLPEDEFLDFISKETFKYFWNEASHVTGFIRDRSIIHSPSSIAAIGFGLAAICIADFRGWITRKEAYTRVKKTLISIKNKAEQKNGFFYHFIDMHTGRRVWDSEVSSIDTALLLAGIILVREYFDEEDIKNLCDQIYFQVNWPWMMEQKSKALYMGWTPESEFKKFILWDMFGEQMIMYILGLGSPTFPLPRESWDAFRRPVKTYNNFTYIYCESESLFTYQYSHAFIDFRNIHDRYANYWKNSILATKANRAFCIEHRNRYRAYREGFWGISASDGPSGYRNYGATIFTHDGTIAPYAICASMPFVPKIAIDTLRKLLSEYGNKVWGRYGFVSAFNLDKNWFSVEHIGIDLGITLLMIENYRSGFVWKYFNKNKYIKNGLKKAGFKEGKGKLNLAYLKRKFGEEKIFIPEKIFRAKKSSIPLTDFIRFNLPDDIEFGEIKDSTDLDPRFSFSWDKDHLYFVIEVIDNRIIAKEKKQEIYRQDCVELFLSPFGEDFIWGDKRYFQFGFAPDSIEKKPVIWAFFQNLDPSEEGNIKFNINKEEQKYSIYAAINWNFLGIKPKPGISLGMSVAVHDIDEIGETGTKINWSFKNTTAGIKLGKLYLE